MSKNAGRPLNTSFIGLSWRHNLSVSISLLTIHRRPQYNGTTKFVSLVDQNKINHRCIQIDRWAKQTCRHRPMDVGPALADNQTSYFITGRQDKLSFGAKGTVQCSDQLKHKIALKFGKK